MPEELNGNVLTCECKTCVSHRHLVKDYHPEIPWKSSKIEKMKILRDLEKTWGKETAKKMFDKGEY